MKARRIVLALAIAAMLTACADEKKGADAGAAGAMPPTEVDVITVAAAPATLTQELPGRLQAVRTAQVRARVEGVVEKRLFEEGSDVAAGKSLFLIEPRTYAANAASADADVAAARLMVERYKPLLEINAVSRQEYDQAVAKLRQAEAALARARLDLENASVPAPISGRIGRTMVTEGALVGRGEASLLATIEQLDPIYVNFTESNADTLRLQQAIKAGKLKRSAQMRVELLLEDGAVYPQPGRLMFSDLAVDPNTGSIQMRAEFPNPKRELLPGTFVRIRVPRAEMDRAIKLPQRAVMSSPQGQSVMIVDAESKVVPWPITTGAMAGADWIVEEGLKGGERVIVNGLQKVRPGSPVKPLPWKPAAAAGEKK